MAEYPAVAKSLAEEELSYWFINYVGQQRADEQEPQVGMVC